MAGASCPNCGAKVGASMKYCPDCGKKLKGR
jgi:predicted amidophosphoribosyltransferase